MAEMIPVDEIEIKEISDHFKVSVATEMILAPQNVVTPRVYDKHVYLVNNVRAWTALVPGHFMKNFATIYEDFCFYEFTEDVTKALIAAKKAIGFLSLEEDKIFRATSMINIYNVENPLILFSKTRERDDTVTVYVLDVCEPEYVCFKLIPKKRFNKTEQVEIDYFWEIVSVAISSDGRTAFEIRMKWR